MHTRMTLSNVTIWYNLIREHAKTNSIAFDLSKNAMDTNNQVYLREWQKKEAKKRNEMRIQDSKMQKQNSSTTKWYHHSIEYEHQQRDWLFILFSSKRFILWCSCMLCVQTAFAWYLIETEIIWHIFKSKLRIGCHSFGFIANMPDQWTHFMCASPFGEHITKTDKNEMKPRK